ncbi:MAG: hypothetical protein ABF377_03560 [Akkermansiaceae bacterium]
MSAKKGDLTLLIPGATGWEIWNGSTAAGLSKRSESESRRALDVGGYPSGPIQMALPVRQLVALPFRAQTNDLALIDDLAEMHLERNGVRPSLDGGQLTDHFVYAVEGEETALNAVVLTTPTEGELPKRSPKAFDLSPRCLPLPSEKIAIWKELGRWVFALGNGEKVLYFQCLPGERLDDRAGKDVRLALTQLQLQGLLETMPSEAVVWTTGGVADARPEELESFARGLGLEAHPSPKPSPIWPTPPSKLLPADVRAERAEKASKRNRTILVAALVLAYLGLAAYLFTDLKKAEKDAKLAERKVEELSGGTTQLMALQDKWDELAPVVEADYYPYEVYLRVAKCLPNKPERKVRLTLIDINNQPKLVEGQGMVMVRDIVVKGEAQDTADIAEFAIALQRSDELAEFEWIIQPEKQTRTGAWGFTYTAKVPL